MMGDVIQRGNDAAPGKQRDGPVNGIRLTQVETGRSKGRWAAGAVPASTYVWGIMHDARLMRHARVQGVH